MPLFFTNRRLLLAGLVLASVCGDLRAAPEPYVPDAHTLHLWHLDEVKPPFIDSAESSIPLLGILNGPRTGQPALKGFSSSISFNAHVSGTVGNSDLKGAILTAAPFLAVGPADNVDPGFSYFGPDGAFTYEMILRLDILPGEARQIALGLVSMDADDADRIFNFRIEKEGYLAFFPLPHSGAMGGGVATIPVTGPHAVDTKGWFHVAVSYDGNGGVRNNLKLYWTRLGIGATQANRIGTGALSNDFNGRTGDFALGNEARGFIGNAEAEPFPGCIDEVRMSGVARHPSDFFFVDPEHRISPEQVAREVDDNGQTTAFQLMLAGVYVDGKEVSAEQKARGVLKLGSGLHRLDFDFGYHGDQAEGDVKLRCQLEGVDERWRDTDQGMTLVCQALDGDDKVLSQSRFTAFGHSAGWETSLEESAMTRRSEPVFIPAGARKLKISLASGSPDTTGFYAVDNFELRSPVSGGAPVWKSGGYAYDAITTSPAGYLPGWKRGGAEPAIARLIIRAGHPALGLVDGDQFRDGEWSAVKDLEATPRGDGTFVLSWDEVFNVIDGDTRRATYVNVPPGRYTFRAMGLAGNGLEPGSQLALAVVVDPPVWQRVWFWPVIASAMVALISSVIFSLHRQRAKRSMERLRFQNALEKDRTRIARDMHDDLGTRVTFINMSATIAQRDFVRAPDNATRHIAKMKESTRELIVAMDDLVWAVDPSFDTLDHLGSHLTRLAEDMFRDSEIRCRLDIPPLLPALSLGSEVRHHIALAVKEALHNVHCHAGPSEVFFSLTFNGEEIRITIRDTGVGFDLTSDDRGHGLDNLASRFKEIGGCCKITSSPGSGTCIVLSCPVAGAKR